MAKLPFYSSNSTAIIASDWRSLAPTDKQLRAIWKMTSALGLRDFPDPVTRGEASDDIKKLKSYIERNLSILGVTNPQHSCLFKRYEDAYEDFCEQF